MAATEAGALLTEAHRLAQARLGGQVASQSLAAWNLVDIETLTATTGTWLQVSVPLIKAQHRQSAVIAADYLRKTGATAEQVAAWMDAETWFTAAEAKAAGFVDEIEGAADGDKSARWNLSAYANAPKPAEPDAGALLAEQADRQQRLNRSRLGALIPRI